MNVNVSMNFNAHNIQYGAGYNVPSSTNPTNMNYDPFYGSNRHGIPTNYHHNALSSDLKHRNDPVTSKQAMLLSTAGSYDYKDFSKFCDFFPTATSSTAGSTEKRA